MLPSNLMKGVKLLVLVASMVAISVAVDKNSSECNDPSNPGKPIALETLGVSNALRQEECKAFVAGKSLILETGVPASEKTQEMLVARMNPEKCLFSDGAGECGAKGLYDNFLIHIYNEDSIFALIQKELIKAYKDKSPVSLFRYLGVLIFQARMGGYFQDSNGNDSLLKLTLHGICTQLRNEQPQELLSALDKIFSCEESAFFTTDLMEQLATIGATFGQIAGGFFSWGFWKQELKSIGEKANDFDLNAKRCIYLGAEYRRFSCYIPPGVFGFAVKLLEFSHTARALKDPCYIFDTAYYEKQAAYELWNMTNQQFLSMENNFDELFFTMCSGCPASEVRYRFDFCFRVQPDFAKHPKFRWFDFGSKFSSFLEKNKIEVSAKIKALQDEIKQLF